MDRGSVKPPMSPLPTRISSELVLAPQRSVAQEMEARLQLRLTARRAMVDARESTTGIPRDSVLHRVTWDHVTCASELRRLLRCGEQHIDMIFCATMKDDYYLCRKKSAFRYS